MGRYAGCRMAIYGEVLPGSRALVRVRSISLQARQRLRVIDWHRAHGGKVRLTCRHFGISHETFYRWQRRFRPGDLRSLEGRSSRPHRLRQPLTDPRLVARMVALREVQPAWSKYKLFILLQAEGWTVSASTIGRVLTRKHLIGSRGRQLRRRYRTPRSKAPIGLTYAQPGSLVQIDTKHLPTPGKTYYQVTAIDTATRLTTALIVSQPSSTATRRILDRITATFPFSIQAIQTDNGSEFLGRFHQAAVDRGLAHYFIDPRCPKQNSVVERVIQTASYEHWYQGRLAAGNAADQQQALEEWLTVYNTQRPHQSLAYQTPAAYARQWTDKLTKCVGR